MVIESRTDRRLRQGRCIHLAEAIRTSSKRIIRFIPLRARRLDLVPSSDPIEAALLHEVVSTCALRRIARRWPHGADAGIARA